LPRTAANTADAATDGDIKDRTVPAARPESRFGQTGGVGSFRQGYAAAASVVLFILVMIFGLSANWFVNRRERKYLG